MDTRRHLYLDLEDTILEPVDSWWRTTTMNIELVKRFIAQFQPHLVHIYSYAIWNTEEHGKFSQSGCRGALESLLDVKFASVLRVDEDIIPSAVSTKAPQVMGINKVEVDCFWGKNETFRYNVRDWFKGRWRHLEENTEVVLLDDSVWDENFEYPDLHIRGQIKNITRMS